MLTRRICLGLQHRDAHSAQHGYETGRIVMLADGEFIEVEAALPEEVVARMGLEYRQGPPPALEPLVDEHGVRSRRRHNPIERVRGASAASCTSPTLSRTPTATLTVHANGHAGELTEGSGDRELNAGE